jgi:hypothetical protein
MKLLQSPFARGVDLNLLDEPEGLKKNMDKFTIEDIPRYVRYPVVFRNWPSEVASV